MISDTALTLWHGAAPLLGIAAGAAATLPFMAALALLLGRRGHAAFCLRGGAALAGLGLWLAAAWPALIVGEALMQLSGQGDAALSTRLMAFFTPAGMGISLSVASWCLGALCAWVGRAWCLQKAAALPPGAESYAARGIRAPLAALFAASGCALTAFAARDWPFAGLPPGLDAWRAAGAVVKHAFRAYFAALSSGGAVGLVMAAHVARRGSFHGPLGAADAAGGVRWCAVWAVAGCVPQLLERWGLALGLWLRGGALILGNPRAQWFQVAALALISLAVAAWSVLLLRREPLRRLWLATLGLGLLLLSAVAPWALGLIFS